MQVSIVEVSFNVFSRAAKNSPNLVYKTSRAVGLCKAYGEGNVFLGFGSPIAPTVVFPRVSLTKLTKEVAIDKRSSSISTSGSSSKSLPSACSSMTRF
uniref:Uncharacterized protein n=1 Tax=Glossina palpalis gambiensis TaxID=67801 RepID=A0A1B0BCH7_9MUSC